MEMISEDIERELDMENKQKLSAWTVSMQKRQELDKLHMEFVNGNDVNFDDLTLIKRVFDFLKSRV